MKNLKQGEMRIWLITSVIAVFILICIQFTGTTVTNPSVGGAFEGPKAVEQIFKRACYDCHSNESKLAWYDKIAPISWQVANDVRTARSRFNFSRWNDLTAAEQETKLWYIVNMIDQGKMPLKSYVLLHPSSKVSETELAVLKDFMISYSAEKALKKSKLKLKLNLKETHARNQKPIALNGVAYTSDYKNWEVISATNRFDNGTMRIIYGNDITVKAIKENNINQWLEGAVIVKVVWNKLPEDQNGEVKTGDFNNAQFMVKDSKKFKDTEGWGFARFSSPKLLAYGKNACFATECINCHQLASKTGFVFDIPNQK
ncbi:heme-binding domain-containing protein [Pedobacter psychrodurus]|uniref:heme-binding domain-containing protein n=1 Tax=Pedobacter psychrodurus TaxID=2530456 RepID=UPI00292E56E6|nr:heme-binding domain-containing protein [Pedobacter psychrodurus]